MELKYSVKIFTLISLLSLMISVLPSVHAQSSRTSTEDVISQLSNLMDNTYELDPAVESAWEDYQELLTTAEYQDYVKENPTESGSTYEEITEFFTPDAQESKIEYDEYEIEYIYTYETTNLDQLSIHLYLYNGGLYATAFISNQIEVSDDAPVTLEQVNKVIDRGFQKMSVLEEADPTVFGVINMVKDDQLGSIVAFPSQEVVPDVMLEFITYEGDINTASVYFTPENYTNINNGTLMPISDQLVYYAIDDFIPTASLNELVTRNTTDNIGYRLAHEQLVVLLNVAVVRGLEDNVAGTTMEEVKELFDPQVETAELTLEDPLTALVYRFEDPNNANNIGILTAYFYENQLAFVSVENVKSNWSTAEVNIDYTRGITEDAIQVGDTITALSQTEMEVPAIGIMFRDALPHQVAVIPVKDSEDEVIFVDIFNYRIENYSTQQITDDTGELSDDLFYYIFDQY